MLFKLIRVKLFRKINYVHLGFIQKSMGSVITRMCLRKRKGTQILITNKTVIKTHIVRQTNVTTSYDVISMHTQIIDLQGIVWGQLMMR